MCALPIAPVVKDELQGTHDSSSITRTSVNIEITARRQIHTQSLVFMNESLVSFQLPCSRIMMEMLKRLRNRLHALAKFSR